MNAQKNYNLIQLLDKTIKDCANEIIITDSSDKYVLTEMVKEKLPQIEKNVIVKRVTIYLKLFHKMCQSTMNMANKCSPFRPGAASLH